MKTICVQHECNNGLLKKQVIQAKRSDRNSQKVIQKQKLEATNMMDSLETTMNNNEELRSRVIDLEIEVEEGHKMLGRSQAATPVTII